MVRPFRADTRGVRVVTNVGRDAMDARWCRKTSGASADGEVVWSWRPDAGVKFRKDDSCEATVAKEPGHRGEHEAAVKTIARGMPGVSGVTVVTNACAFYTPHAAAGASSARHSLRPLISVGCDFQGKTRAMQRRERGGVLASWTETRGRAPPRGVTRVGRWW